MITIPDVRLGKRWEGVIEEKGNSLPWIYHRTSNPKGKLNKSILISGTCINERRATGAWVPTDKKL